MDEKAGWTAKSFERKAIKKRKNFKKEEKNKKRERWMRRPDELQKTSKEKQLRRRKK